MYINKQKLTNFHFCLVKEIELHVIPWFEIHDKTRHMLGEN